MPSKIISKLKGIKKEIMSSKRVIEQRKEFKEYLTIADKIVLDIKKSGIELMADTQ